MVGWGLLYLELVLEWDKSISIGIHMILHILHRAVLDGDKIYSIHFTLPMSAVKIARGLLYLETVFELGKTWRIVKPWLDPRHDQKICGRSKCHFESATTWN